MRSRCSLLFALLLLGQALAVAQGPTVPVSQSVPAYIVPPTFSTSVSTVGPSSVAGTTSTAALVMAGLGGSFTTHTGRFELCMSGNIDNTTVNDGGLVRLSFGTTFPVPTLNAPVQGTQVGPTQQSSQAALAAATITPYGACWLVTGQTPNTTFWTDVAYEAITGGTAVLSQASVVAHDIP